MRVVLPEDWAPPVGYANGIAINVGRIVIAGQVSRDAEREFHSAKIASRFEQALQDVLAEVAEAGGEPRHGKIVSDLRGAPVPGAFDSGQAVRRAAW